MEQLVVLLADINEHVDDDDPNSDPNPDPGDDDADEVLICSAKGPLPGLVWLSLVPSLPLLDTTAAAAVLA